VAGAEQRNARLASAVMANGSDNRVVVVERRIRTLSRSLSRIDYRSARNATRSRNGNRP